jgi:hypothetical protein
MRARACSGALLAGLLCAALSAAPALAGWSSGADAGSLAVSSASIAAPAGTAAAQGACTPRKAKSLTVVVTWTATSSPEATGYTILRATAPGGPFSTVGSVGGIGTTTWTDATGQLAFRTTYYYVVEATVQSWTSPQSGAGSVTTPKSKTCA